MSRDFNGDYSHLRRTASIPVSGNTHTIAGWFYCASVPVDNRSLYSWGDAASNNAQMLLIRGTQSGALRVYDGVGGFGTEPTANVMTAGEWQHFAVVSSGNSSRRVILNGDWANSVSGTATFTWYAEEIYLGVWGAQGAAVDYPLDGMMAHVAVWDTDLSQSQIEGLAGGDNPLAVANSNLVAYWELPGDQSPEVDSKGSYDLTLQDGARAALPLIRTDP